MDIRRLEKGDMEALSGFITESFDDYPESMWFENRPSKDEIKLIFHRKIDGIASGIIADFVAVENGRIIGECEIVKLGDDSGIIGIIVRKEAGRKRIGTMLLGESLRAAKRIGISGITAEVSKGNAAGLKFFEASGFIRKDSMLKEKNGKRSEIVVLQRGIR